MQILCPPVLSKGSHTPDEGKVCVWEAVNIAMTGELTDKCPPCTHPALHSAIMSCNDAVSDAARNRVWPYALRALGTCDRDSAEIAATAMRYAFKCADDAVRTHAPAALDAAGLTEEAAKLRALPVINSANSARSAANSANSAADSARRAANSAYSAYSANSAAYSAAYSAADSANSAAYSANSANSAAYSADSAYSAAYSARSAANSAYSAANSANSAAYSARRADGLRIGLLEALLPG